MAKVVEMNNEENTMNIEAKVVEPVEAEKKEFIVVRAAKAVGKGFKENWKPLTIGFVTGAAATLGTLIGISIHLNNNVVEEVVETVAENVQ